MAPILISLTPTPLAESVARLLHTNLLVAPLHRFADSECNVALADSDQFRGQDVHIFQSTGAPVNDTVLGVAFLAQQLKQAGASKVTLISPYFGYSRQEKSSISAFPGSVAIIAKLLESAGIDELITVELHDPLVKSFFTIPVHELSLNDTIAQQIKWHFGSRTDVCLIAPDKGAHERIAKIALLVGAGILVFSKERYAADKTRVVGVAGTCVGKTAILIDDIIDTAGTAINVAEALNDMKQFHEIVGYFVHPVFSGDALDRIEKSPFTQIFVANTLPVVGEGRKVLSFDISAVLAEFIWKVSSD